LKLHTSLNSYTKAPSVITIGTFDGVHIGHQKIIDRLIKVGQQKDLKSLVLTFFPHPRMVLQSDTNIKLLNTIEERQNILSHTQLDHLVTKKFTADFANLSAHDYVKDILVDALNAKHIIIGYDHHFGKNRSANINDLKTFGKQFGFEVEEISVQDIEDVAVSSTKIRAALNQGKITVANSYLGYAYYISGTVVKGKGLGKQIGFPIVKSTLHNATIYGMMNIGTNPTVNGTSQTIEVNFFNVDENLYDKTLKIELLKRLRDEHKFSSVDALKTQLKIDAQNAHQFINTLDA